MNKFICVGFEFTAAVKAKSKPLKYVYIIPRLNILEREFVNLPIFKKKYPWICSNFEPDFDYCEAPTPKIKRRTDIIKKYTEFRTFVKECNLTLDINKAKTSLGGCHIHMDLSFMKRSVKILFLRNMAIYMTNNPWLNWGFNDPNDNINANSLLVKDTHENIFNSIQLWNGSEEDFDVKCSAKTKQSINTFRWSENPYKIFKEIQLEICLFKHFAIRYNRKYDSLELRIFDMPSTLKQHILHYDVAMAIYNRCYDYTKRKEEIGVIFTDCKEFMHMNKSEALCRFDNCMKELGIDRRRTGLMRFNISTRHKWQSMIKRKDNTNLRKCYFL